MTVRWRTGWLVLLALITGGCTAIAVVTHNPTTDAAKAPPGLYRLDPDHAAVVFTVDHLQFARYVGRFDRLDAELAFDGADPTASRLTVAIQADSVDTNNAVVEELLKARPMFDVERYPTITFTSTEIALTGERTGRIDGLLTVKDRSRPVSLDVTFNGSAPNPLTSDYTLGFSATATIDRADLGLGQWIPAVGGDVDLLIEVEFKHVGPGDTPGA